MTVIRILLIAGLVYIALQQKKESTRNKILVVTGLLAFCMMGKEGLTQIAAVAASCTGTATTVPATCTETANTTVPADAAACTAGTVDLRDNTACSAVMTAADVTVSACTYTTASTPTCDLLAATDGSADCPAGCSSVAASVATTVYDNVNCSKNTFYNNYNSSDKSCDWFE
jgi:hypothetical protein